MLSTQKPTGRRFVHTRITSCTTLTYATLLFLAHVNMPSATMVPSAVRKPQRVMARRSSKPFTTPSRSCLFNRSARSAPYRVKSASSQTLHLENGWNVLDASGGAAVSCIGHNNARVKQAMMKALDSGMSYISSMMFDTEVTEDFARFLVNSTEGKMSKAVFYSSGKQEGTRPSLEFPNLNLRN